MLLLTLMLSAVDGGAVPTLFAGTLEARHRYELRGEHAPARGLDLLASELTPPRLRIPLHHAVRVEWLESKVLIPAGRVRVVFEVEAIDVVRMTERRWNTTYRCRLLSAEPAPLTE